MAFIDWRKKQRWISIYYAKLKEMNEKQCFPMNYSKALNFVRGNLSHWYNFVI